MSTITVTILFQILIQTCIKYYTENIKYIVQPPKSFIHSKWFLVTVVKQKENDWAQLPQLQHRE